MTAISQISQDVLGPSQWESRRVAMPPETHVVAQEKVATALQQATYMGIRLWFEQNAGLLITQFRDPTTGEVKNQYPAEEVLKRYQESAPQKAAEEAARNAATGDKAAVGDAADPQAKGTGQDGSSAPEPVGPTLSGTGGGSATTTEGAAPVAAAATGEATGGSSGRTGNVNIKA